MIAQATVTERAAMVGLTARIVRLEWEWQRTAALPLTPETMIRCEQYRGMILGLRAERDRWER